MDHITHTTGLEILTRREFGIGALGLFLAPLISGCEDREDGGRKSAKSISNMPADEYVKYREPNLARIADMNSGHIHGGVETYKGRLYVVAGTVSVGCGSQSYSDVFEVYDPLTNAWTQKEPLPEKRGYATTFILDNQLFVVGGNRQVTSEDVKKLSDPCAEQKKIDGSVDTVFSYDLEKGGHWRRMNSFRKKGDAFSFVSEGAAYVVSGNEVYRYDSQNDSWQKVTEVPKAYLRACCAELNGKFYLIGRVEKQGDDWTTVPVVQTLDVKTLKWNEKEVGGMPAISGYETYTFRRNNGVWMWRVKKYVEDLSDDFRSPSIFIYSPLSNTFREVSGFPRVSEDLTIWATYGVVGDNIYALGRLDHGWLTKVAFKIPLPKTD